MGPGSWFPGGIRGSCPCGQVVRGVHILYRYSMRTGIIRTGTKETPPWRKKTVSFSPYATMAPVDGIGGVHYVLVSKRDGESLILKIMRNVLCDVICKRADGTFVVNPIDMLKIKQLAGGKEHLLNLMDSIYPILRRYQSILSYPNSTLRLISGTHKLTYEYRIVIQLAIEAFDKFVNSSKLWNCQASLENTFKMPVKRARVSLSESS